MEKNPAAAIALPPSFTLERHAGEPLPETVRARMEAYFETDFSTVRVHVGMEAPSLDALAFTVGEHLYFAPDQYQPLTARGLQLLGHELAHVVQQRSGRVPNPFGSGFALIDDPVLEAEAEQQGIEAATTTRPPRAPVPRPPGALPQTYETRGYSIQATFTNRVKNQMLFLMNLTSQLFQDTDDSKLMEVQASIFDKRLFIASNYSKGADYSALAANIAPTYTHDTVTYAQSNSSIVMLASSLHAEQQILMELAKVIANPNKTNPLHVTIVGSKRPCSICRRVLLAFSKALVAHYSTVKLHFVDLTGADCEASKVASLDLDAVAANSNDDTFKAFAKTYATQLASLTGKKLSGEEVATSTRTNATPSVDDMI
jgi:cytidine deaminase